MKKTFLLIFNILVILAAVGITVGLYLIGADWVFFLVIGIPLVITRLVRANLLIKHF